MDRKYAVQDTYKFDPKEMPPSTRGVMFLKGSWYEMGYQYGKNATSTVHRIAASKVAIGRNGFGTVERAIEFIKENYLPIYEKDAPDLIEFFKGVAAGSDLPYETVLLSGTVFNEEDFGCSTLSAWGKATENGEVLAGVNMDEPGYMACYDYNVFFYPDSGNYFVGNRGPLQNVNLLMNSKGVVCMNSAGQNALPEDIGFGIPNAKAGMIACWRANTAEEARDEYMSRGAGNGENCNIVDTSGQGYVVEHTARTNAYRQAGEHGEEDFLINTNGEFTAEMQDSIFQLPLAFPDSLPRYWTEEKIIKDNIGHVTKDVIAKALGAQNTYVDKDYLDTINEGGHIPGWKPMGEGMWLDDPWNLERGDWTPENRGPGWKSLIRNVCDPQTKELFTLNGPADTLATPQCNATGNFCRLTLEDSPKKVNDEARAYAQMMQYYACRDIDQGNARDDVARINALEESKKALFEGINYQMLADASEDECDYLGLLSKSTSAFCRCQCYAQLAQDDPTKIDRDKSVKVDSNFIGA